MYKRTEEKRQIVNFKDIGNIFLIITTIVIPVAICLLETSINYNNQKFLQDFLDNNSSEAVTELYAVVTEMQIINSGISIIAIAVSVWIGLNIYNNCKEKHFEHLIKELQFETEQLKKEYQKRLFLSYMERTADMYELSEFFYDVFRKEIDEVNEREYEVLSKIEREFASCCQYYEKGNKKVSAEFAKKGNDIIVENQMKSYLIDDSLVDFYMILRKADFVFYESMHGGTIQNKDLIESIEEYEQAYQYLQERKSKMNRDKYNRLEAYMLNSIGYTYVRLVDNNPPDSDRENWLNKAFENLEKIALDGAKGRYYQNLGACYEKSNRDGRLENAFECYLKAYKARNKDPKIYNLLGSVYLKLVDEKLGINDREELLSGDKQVDTECISYIEMALLYLEIALHITPELIDVYYNYAKANFYDSLWIKGEKTRNLKTENLLRLAEGRSPNNSGVLFTYRNYYEAIGDIEKAKEYNRRLKGKGDSKRIGKLYE